MTPGPRGEGHGEGTERGGWGGQGRGSRGGGERNARSEERTSECGRELVRAGAFPRANFRARDGQRQRGRDGERDSATAIGGRRERTEGTERERESERERGSSEQEKRRSRPGARWDVNFLAVRSFVRRTKCECIIHGLQGTLIFCRGRVVGRARQGGSRAVCRAGAGLRGWWSSTGGGWPSTRYITYSMTGGCGT